MVAMGLFCGCQKQEQPVTGDRLRIVTTLFPIYDFARTVGGSKVEVRLLLPPGVEPHSFEPKPEDLVRISKADIFIYTNRYMEPWAENILKGVAAKKLLVVDAGAGANYMPAGGEDGDDDHGAEKNGHRHGAGLDPHIWLDPDNARTIVDNITSALTQKDPANRGYYLANASAYKARLAELDGRFRQGLADCQSREFLHGGHYAFGYLARRYNLHYLSAYGMSANAEPPPRKLVEIIVEMKKSGLKHIFYEELLAPRVATTIARESGATLLKLHGLHNISREDMDRGATFISLMEQNLASLRTGLKCR
jgi:zinc transport system substrate-binding protein